MKSLIIISAWISLALVSAAARIVLVIISPFIGQLSPAARS